MNKVKVLILREQGTNCDNETAFAFEQAGAVTTLVHIDELIRHQRKLGDFQIMAIPGGFTYGDDLGAGRVLANEIKLKLGQEIQTFIESGRLILGICNGFQVLVKAGILPGPIGSQQLISFTSNDSGKFECRWVHLRVNEECPCLFTKGIERLYLPVAHGEGKVVAVPEALAKIRVALYYVDEMDNKAGYPYNPNGSIENIAGICDDSGRIFAVMPHPERYIWKSQHPQWTRKGVEGRGDGFKIFANAVKWAQSL